MVLDHVEAVCHMDWSKYTDFNIFTKDAEDAATHDDCDFLWYMWMQLKTQTHFRSEHIRQRMQFYLQ